MSGFLKLTDVAPLAKGHSRLVYQHPENPDHLIKVIRPEVIEKRWGSGTAWYKRRRRYGRFISYVREVQEYVVGCLATGNTPEFVQRIAGFADTDLGLGLIVEAVRGPDGTLAPTLGQLIDLGRFGEAEDAALEAFGRHLLESDIVVSDLNLGNLVYTGGNGVAGRFVMIDGVGEASFLPLKSWSRGFNRHSKLGRWKRMRSRMEQRRRKNLPDSK